MNDRQYVVYVADLEGVRYTLALDITEFESDETVLSLYVALFSLLLAVLIGALAAWGVARLLRPVSDLAADIERLDPNRPGQRRGAMAGGGH